MQASQSQPKSSPAAIARATAWNKANRERHNAASRRHYLKVVGGALKPALTSQQRFDASYSPEALTGCWLWTASVNRWGYGKTKVDGKHVTAHRWAWALHNGPIPDGLHVLHRCDVPACVNPAHLWLGTNRDNDRDKRAKGRHFVMPLHREPKITEAQALEAIRLRGKETQWSIAKRLGLHPSHVSRIQRGKYWAHLAR